MNILTNIANHKRKQVATRKELYPVALLEKSPFFETTPVSLTRYLLRPDKSGIIAEFKRKSPSKGVINAYVSIDQVSIGYMQGGASALSILTDEEFFGGKNEDLIRARELNYCPILRKDFILDPYQVLESKSIGADAILLIAAILTPAQTLELARLARSLGMETILEVHSRDELVHRNGHISIIGVNNRNLADFSVNLETSMSLSEFIDKDDLFISESGLREPSDIRKLRLAGYRGFLIGEQFMATSDPATACQQFISQLKSEYP
ncbi:MAG: indole-3-glycerol phosphate synthase [Bacteroidetes bacterium GWF2_49_14]|nr:MAG: indole-3-glycerol phosphate synthase [Bacteroidetes bacterium GWF2_49_14]